MKDIYLHSSDYDSMVSSLKTINPEFVYEEDGIDVIKTSDRKFSIYYCGRIVSSDLSHVDENDNVVVDVAYYDGVYCNLRVDDFLEELFSTLPSTVERVYPETPNCVFGKM